MYSRGKILYGVLVTLIVLLAVSITLNIVYLRRNRSLEDNVWITKLRLTNFAIETGTIVMEAKKLTVDDLKRSSMLGAPWEEGNGYIISRDAHYAFGIKYLFDDQGRLTGWMEEPEIKFRYEHETGEVISRDFKAIVYEDDGLTVDCE